MLCTAPCTQVYNRRYGRLEEDLMLVATVACTRVHSSLIVCLNCIRVQPFPIPYQHHTYISTGTGTGTVKQQPLPIPHQHHTYISTGTGTGTACIKLHIPSPRQHCLEIQLHKILLPKAKTYLHQAHKLVQYYF